MFEQGPLCLKSVAASVRKNMEDGENHLVQISEGSDFRTITNTTLLNKRVLTVYLGGGGEKDFYYGTPLHIKTCGCLR